MGVAFSSTSEYTKEAVNSIADLNPNAADILISSVITSLTTDLGVVSPTASGLLTMFDGNENKVSTVDGYFVSPKEYNGFDHEQHIASLTYGGYVETGIKANTIAVPGVYKILEYVHKKFGSIPLENLFEYDLSQKLEQIIPSYTFDSTCQGSVPQAIIALLESEDYEDAIRNSISLGGDADTQACITGSLAEAYYKDIPDDIASFVKWRIEDDLLAVMDQFNSITKQLQV